jgi:hypothetical protein
LAIADWRLHCRLSIGDWIGRLSIGDWIGDWGLAIGLMIVD